MYNLLLEMGICLMHDFGKLPICYTEWLGFFPELMLFITVVPRKS